MARVGVVVVVDHDNCPWACEQLAQLQFDPADVRIYLVTARTFTGTLPPACTVVTVAPIRQEADIAIAVLVGRLDERLARDCAIALVSTDAAFEQISAHAARRIPLPGDAEEGTEGGFVHCDARPPLSWSSFQRGHAGSGHTPAELSALYRASGSAECAAQSNPHRRTVVLQPDRVHVGLAVARLVTPLRGAAASVAAAVEGIVSEVLAAAAISDDMAPEDIARAAERVWVSAHPAALSRLSAVNIRTSAAFAGEAVAHVLCARRKVLGAHAPHAGDPLTAPHSRSEHPVLSDAQRALEEWRAQLAAWPFDGPRKAPLGPRERALRQLVDDVSASLAEGLADVDARPEKFSFVPFRRAFRAIATTALRHVSPRVDESVSAPAAVASLQGGARAAGGEWPAYASFVASVHDGIRTAGPGGAKGSLVEVKSRETGITVARLVAEAAVRLLRISSALPRGAADAFFEAEGAVGSDVGALGDEGASDEGRVNAARTPHVKGDRSDAAATARLTEQLGAGAVNELQRTSIAQQLELLSAFRHRALADCAESVCSGLRDVERRPSGFSFEQFRAALKTLAHAALALHGTPSTERSSVPQMLSDLSRAVAATKGSHSHGEWASVAAQLHELYAALKIAHNGPPGYLTTARCTLAGTAAGRMFLRALGSLDALAAECERSRVPIPHALRVDADHTHSGGGYESKASNGAPTAPQRTVGDRGHPSATGPGRRV